MQCQSSDSASLIKANNVSHLLTKACDDGFWNIAEFLTLQKDFSPTFSWLLVWEQGFILITISRLQSFTLRVWTRFSSLSYHLIIVVTGTPEAKRQLDISTGRYAHTDVHSGRCGLQEGLPVVSSLLLFINLSNAIKDCQQEWKKEREREDEKREREIAYFFPQIWLPKIKLVLSFW